MLSDSRILVGAVSTGSGLGSLSAATGVSTAISGAVAASSSLDFRLAGFFLFRLLPFVSAIFVGSVDTRMAENVVGPKVPPSQIGKVVVNAVVKQVEDVDSDIMAIDVRAGLARDPKKVERQMYRRMKLEKGE